MNDASTTEIGTDTESKKGGFDLQVEGLAKSFETDGGIVRVLDGVSFQVRSGESVSVVGPSGCGKSTLLQLLGALDRPTAGRLRVGGRDPSELDEKELARFRNRTIGFVFQDHHLLPQYSVLENILLPTLAFPADAGAPATLRRRAEELAESVGLSHRLDHRPAQISGGERQRAAIARALILAPGLLLCDEPTGNLDQSTAGTVADLLFDLHRREGNVLVVVTHSPELAARCERSFEMRDGLCLET